MQIVIDIPKDLKEDCDAPYGLKAEQVLALREAVKWGTVLPEHHGDLKDIGNMELLNVQVHDDYSKGWHNAIEYCVRQLRERDTIIPATESEVNNADSD